VSEVWWKITEEMTNMKKLLTIFLLLFSINSYCEILNLECISIKKNHKYSLVIDTSLKTIYVPVSKITSPLIINSNEYRWSYSSNEGIHETTLNRYTGIENSKTTFNNGTQAFSDPYTCEVIVSRKF